MRHLRYDARSGAATAPAQGLSRLQIADEECVQFRFTSAPSNCEGAEGWFLNKQTIG